MLAINPKIKFTRIREVLKRTLWTLGEKAFLVFLVLLFLGIAFSVILFYQSSISAKKSQQGTLEKPLQLDEGLLGKVLGIREEREKIFNKTEQKQYPDPFWRVIPSLEGEDLE